MIKQRLREIKQYTQDHRGSKWGKLILKLSILVRLCCGWYRNFSSPRGSDFAVCVCVCVCVNVYAVCLCLSCLSPAALSWRSTLRTMEPTFPGVVFNQYLPGMRLWKVRFLMVTWHSCEVLWHSLPSESPPRIRLKLPSLKLCIPPLLFLTGFFRVIKSLDMSPCLGVCCCC